MSHVFVSQQQFEAAAYHQVLDINPNYDEAHTNLQQIELILQAQDFAEPEDITPETFDTDTTPDPEMEPVGR